MVDFESAGVGSNEKKETIDSPLKPLIDLLCLIHRDGGQYINRHGMREAVIMARIKIIKLNQLTDTIREIKNEMF